MKGDFTRFTFDPKKHYSGVRMQQGRVLLDSDWNEQADIFDHRSEIEAKDIIGRSGCPIDQAGFNIIQSAEDLNAEDKEFIREEGLQVDEICNKINNLKPGDFIIFAGRFYIDGIVCENEEVLYYSEQRHHPKQLNDVTASEMERMQFPYIVYLDVWKRHISVIEDPEIREIALGGPDTTTRVETVWQVRALMPRIEVSDNCIDVSEIIPAMSNGRLNVKLSSSTAKSSKCSMAPRGGYQGLENRLYRVEIHDSGQPFGWQKDIQDREGYPDNAGIYGIEYPQSTGDEIHDGKDGLIVVEDWYPDGLSWRPGQMVEIFPLGSREKGTLARIKEVDHSKMLLKLDKDISKLATLGQPDLMFHRVATFKWSRDNGSIVYSIGSSPKDQPKKVLVKSLGRDKSLSLCAGDCVEVSGDTTELACEPGTMAFIFEDGADEANREFTLDQDVSRHKEENNPRIRRWDRSRSSSPEDMVSPITLDEVELEDGIGIAFSKNPEAEYMDVPSFRTGDYWTFPARSIDGKLKELKDAPAQGIEHHYACLARIPVNTRGDENTASGDKLFFGKRLDCRKFFPSSRDIENVYYLGGDGQEALPGHLLDYPLIVGVAMGRWPVADAQVIFSVVSGGGSIEPQKLPDMGYTEKDGVYFAKWKLGKTGAQVAKAFLFDSSGQVGCPVFFYANLIAGSLCCVSGNNQETMPDLIKAVTDTITKERFIPLAQSVVVQVISNCGPVTDAIVKFRALSGRVSSIVDATISKDISVTVDSEGLARCTWYLFLAIDQVGHYRIYQELEASLESFYGINHVDIVPAPSPIRFTARLNAANEISYDPAACPKLETRRGAMTVQDAINSLCPANILYALSGNGQVGVPGQILTLKVGVADSRGPVSFVQVGFDVTNGGGTTTITDKTTNSEGIVECQWTLGKAGDQQVKAFLAKSNGEKIDGTLSVYFNASLIAASQVAYTPLPDCTSLSGVGTVQNAINALCDRGLHVSRIFAVDDADNKLFLDNSMTLYAGQLTKNGFTISFDDDVDLNAFSGKTSRLSIQVIIDLPYPLRGEEVSAWNSTDTIGYRQIILDGSAEVTTSKRTIKWKPSDATSRYLINQLFYSTAVLNRRIVRTPAWLEVPVLAHLVLKGNFIWSATDPKRYLKSGEDGKRGGDFEMCFWLESWYKCYASALSITLQLASSKIKGGSSTVLTVTINNAAPVGGVIITLQSSNEKIAKVESDTMTILAGSTSSTININSFSQETDISARITAISLIGNAANAVDLTVTK